MKDRNAKAREHSATPTTRRLQGYIVAIVATAIATLLRWVLVRSIGDLPTYLTFYPAVLAAAVVGGTGPGVLAALLSALSVNLFFIRPIGSSGLGIMGQDVGMGLFVAVNLTISLLVGRLHAKSGALRESEARLRHFIDRAPVAIAMLDKEMRYLAASRRWLEVFHLAEQDLRGRSHHELFPEIPERWNQVHERCLAGAVESAEEDFFERADGSRQWVRWEVQPWYTDLGVIGGLVIFTEEITARVKAQEALRQSEERFRTMADAIPQLAWMARPDGYMFWFNRRCYEYSGASPKELEGGGWQNLVDPQVLPKVMELWRRSIASGEPYETQSRLRGADGSFHPFLTRIMPLKDQEGKVTLWFGTATDIAELEQAQEALRQSEERFRTLIELAPTAIGIGRDGIALYVNQKFLETFGSQNSDDYVGRPVSGHWTPESQTVLADHMRQRSPGLRAQAFEAVAQRKDGSLFPAHVATTVVNLSDGPASVAFIIDITERKRLQEHLEEAVQERTVKLHEALAELEHMSYSMVHDMRAPLRAMQGFAGLIEYECSDCLRPPALDYLHRIGESSNRLDRLITDALNYNKVVCENLPITPVDLGQLVRSMVRTYPHLHPSIADITIEFTHVMVLGNESLLTQCFGNLLDNSVKFVARGVRPRVRIWAEAVKSPESAAANREVKNQISEIENPLVRIWIEDNGIGIPENAREKIFQMFQRMHGESEYPGTGIGLAIVRKAVERMNGHISFDSEPGKGTRFCVELPSTDRKAAPESSSTLVLRA